MGFNFNINNNKNMIGNAIDTTLSSFDFAYCIAVNILTYLIINIIISRRGNRDIGTWNKRFVLLCSIIIIGAIYIYVGNDIKLVTNSAILAPVFWSWVMKPICKKFKLDYKQLSLFE